MTRFKEYIREQGFYDLPPEVEAVVVKPEIATAYIYHSSYGWTAYWWLTDGEVIIHDTDAEEVYC